jgi:hypothetical protein
MTSRLRGWLDRGRDGHDGHSGHSDSGIVNPWQHSGMLITSRLNFTTPLDATELLVIDADDGKPRIVLHIRLPERKLTTDISGKSCARRRQRSAMPAQTTSCRCCKAASLLAM